jgi:hypothetical protein
MTSNPIGKLALVWHGEPETNRWHQIFAALAVENIHAEPAVYCEERTDELREQ